MHFKGHLAGAVAAGTLSAGLAAVEASAGAPDDGIVAGLGLGYWPGLGAGALPAEMLVPGLCFVIAGAMALFPDLDIGSIPQRWYLRAMFAALAVAWWLDRPQVFTWLAFAALLPMLHRHRGWTHWLLTPWLMAAALIWMLGALSPPLAVPWRFSRGAAFWMTGEHRVLIFAFVAGHYTHLLLDAGRFGFFPLSARKAKKK